MPPDPGRVHCALFGIRKEADRRAWEAVEFNPAVANGVERIPDKGVVL